MKLNGIVGKGSGKLGASIFAISGGEQIVRQYNPQVANPNTDAQVAQRAKLKLMSQLAAVLAPAIAFKKKGLVSARNQFVAANIGKATFANDKASIPMMQLDLTGGSAILPGVSVVAGDNNNINVNLASAADASVEAVVYCGVSYNDDEPAQLVDVKIVEVAGDGRTFPTTLEATSDFAYVYAYGLTGVGSKSRAKYDDYALTSSGSTGFLDALTSLIKSAASYTQTKASSIGL